MEWGGSKLSFRGFADNFVYDFKNYCFFTFRR